MPKRMPSDHLYELAKRGAEAQLREWIDGIKMLVETFPHLRDSFDKDELPVSFIVAKDSGAVRPAKRRAVRRRTPKP